MSEHKQKIVARMLRRQKLAQILGMGTMVCGMIVLLYVLYFMPMEPRVWLGLFVFALGLWFGISTWDDVMHPEKHEKAPPASLQGQPSG